MSGESGNSWPLSFGAWKAAGATLPAKIQVSASCVVKPQTSSPDCYVFWVISANSCWRSSSIPGAAGLLLGSPLSSVRVYIRCPNSIWSHSGGRNCFRCRSVICRCRSMICCGWLHTICTSRMDCEYCATLINTCCVSANALFNSSNQWHLSVCQGVPW